MQHDSLSAGEKARVISNLFCAGTEATLSARKDLKRRINLRSYAPNLLYLALYSNRKPTSANFLSWRGFRRLHASSLTRSFTRKFTTTCHSPFSPDVSAPKAALGLECFVLPLARVVKMYLCDLLPRCFRL